MPLRFFLRCVVACALIAGIRVAVVAGAPRADSQNPSQPPSYTWWDRSLDKPAPPRPENLHWSDWPRRARYLSARHEDHYTFLHKRSYSKDPFVWGYIAPFAERFHMPEKWIEPKLEGALGVAFRMMFPLTVQCGFGGDPKNCSALPRCQMDVYYDATIDLPWVHENQMRDNLMEGMHSGMFLHDPAYQFRSTNQYYRKRPGPDGTPQPGPLEAPVTFQLGDQSITGTAAHFDRAYMPGVGLISWFGLCPSAPNAETATLTFPDANGTPQHVMRFPGSWLQRAHKDWVAQKDKQNMPLLISVLEKVEEPANSPWPRFKKWLQSYNPFYEPEPGPPPIDSRAYEQNFVHGDGKSFTADPFTWVYTREFAERFHMPEKWIDPGLKGVQAIAFRMVDMGISLCGAGRVADACWPPTTCQMDFYYDTATPWPSDDLFIRDNKEITLHSGTFLHDPTFRNRGVNRFFYSGRVDLDDPAPMRKIAYTIQGVGGSGRILYDHAYRPGLGLISWGRTCPRDRYYKRSTRFFNSDDWEAHSTGKLKKEDIRVVHEIIYPVDFWRRAKVIYKSGNRAFDHMSTELINAYLSKFKKKEETP